MNQIANRIDKGFHIELRAEPLPEGERYKDQKEQAAANVAATSIEKIRSASANIHFIDRSGAQILELPEKPSKGES